MGKVMNLLYLSTSLTFYGLVIFDSGQGYKCRALWLVLFYVVIFFKYTKDATLPKCLCTCHADEYIKRKHFSHVCLRAICKETNYTNKFEVPSFTSPSLTLLSATPEETTVMYWHLYSQSCFRTFIFYCVYETCLLNTWDKLCILNCTCILL